MSSGGRIAGGSLITGSGGGGGKGGGSSYTPSTARDGLDSVQYAKVIDLISEGEIEGLKDGNKSIYINNTALQNTDGTYNFQNVSVYTTNGTQDQAAIPISNNVETEVGVSTTVLNGLPVVRSITKPSVDAVRVTISIPQLQGFTNQGDIIGATVDLKISVQYANGGFTDVAIGPNGATTDTITGRSGDLYQKNYLINFTGSRPVDIKVTRVTADSTDPKLVNAFSWASYTEITYAKLRYPNSALVGLRIDAEQFNSIPTRTYLVRGVKVKIPNNATVDATNGRLIYSGVWGGVFGAAAWCTDPAWILYDLLISTRYGWGDHIKEASLDKFSFYSASQYNSALVSDGFGGTEPRFSCNCNIQTQEDAYKLINDLCSTMRCMPYWSAGSLTISQDRPTDPTYLFSLANVAEGGFSYQNSSKKTRPTVVIVSYLDLKTRDIAYEASEDKDAIAKYGVITSQVTGFGCTSRGQASRLGKWILYEENNSEIVTFTASIEAGVACRPGQVIEIADPMRTPSGSRRGGRITSATTTAITVDDATGLTVANSPTLSCILSGGPYPAGIVETRSVTAITGNVITVGTAFSSAPNTNSIWVFESTDKPATTWRVLSVTEQDEIFYNVTAISYNASKYAYIEDGIPLQPRTAVNLSGLPATPTNFSAKETLYLYQGIIRSKVIVSWKPVVKDTNNNLIGVSNYEIRWRKDFGNWTVTQQPSVDFEILDITPGTFDFKIYSLNASGVPSITALSGSITALGKVAPPSDITNFTAALDPNIGVTLTWDPAPDLDLQGYEVWQGAAWNTGTKIGLLNVTTTKVGLIPASATTTWHIKALDTSGSYSTNAASASITTTATGQPVTTATFANDTILLKWTAVAGSLSTAYYEIRFGPVGNDWQVATVVGTVQATTYSIVGNWIGTKRFFIVTVDIAGNKGSNTQFFDVTINAPSQTIVTQQVVDNNVLLYWRHANDPNPSTLPIVSYEIRKGTTYATSTLIGTKSGRFTSVFELAAGVYTYWVTGVDSAGNMGTPGSISAQVSQPPDYQLQSDQNSLFTGTKTNAVVEGSSLYANVSTTDTWATHFSANGWTTLQAQITAGFPYLFTPSLATGNYIEEFDYGSVLAANKITTVLTSNNIVGTTSFTPNISTRGGTLTNATNYSQTGNIITVNTAAAHGLIVGDLVYLSFATGGATSRTYTVATVPTTTQFTVTATSATIATQTPGVSWAKWTVYSGLNSVFATNFRYVRVQYDFAATGTNNLLQVTNLNVKLDSKLRSDAGSGNALSTDASGTTVLFNVAFIDVSSIAVTPIATTSVSATYSFVDAPNPTQFSVYLFDAAGTRVSGAFSWSARGV
jgi:predicted phage tail protein